MINAECLKNAIKLLIKKHSIGDESKSEYRFYGIRFDGRDDLTPGDWLDNSRHNPDREDSREFPDYGSDGYDELPELDGTSAYEIDLKGLWAYNTGPIFTGEKLIDSIYDNCYLIAGDEDVTHPDADIGEIVIYQAAVVEKIS